MSKFIGLCECHGTKTSFFNKDKIESISCIYHTRKSPSKSFSKEEINDDVHSDNHLWDVCLKTESLEDFKIYCNTYWECIAYIQKLIIRLE